MGRFDVNGFLATLPERGVPAAQLSLYQAGVEELLAGVDGGFGADELEEALARAALQGASERKLANLRLVGEQMIPFVRSQAETILGFGPPRPDPIAIAIAPAPKPAGPAPSAFAPPVAPPLAGLDVVERPRRPPVTAAVEAVRLQPEPPPLPGCICTGRREVYLDDYAQNMWKMYAVVMCVLGVSLGAVFPHLVGVLVSLGLGTIGTLIAGTTVGWRCEHCRRWIAGRGLDEVQRRDVRVRSAIFLAIAAALAIGFVISLHTLRRQLAEQDPVDHALRGMQDLGG